MSKILKYQEILQLTAIVNFGHFCIENLNNYEYLFNYKTHIKEFFSNNNGKIGTKSPLETTANRQNN